jgi:hypothetical protein
MCIFQPWCVTRAATTAADVFDPYSNVTHVVVMCMRPVYLSDCMNVSWHGVYMGPIQTVWIAHIIFCYRCNMNE